MTRVKIWATAVAAVTIAGAAGALPALAGETLSTAVTAFSWTDKDNGTDFFDGSITSTEPKCVKRRQVILYRKESGADPRVAGTETNRAGVFEIQREDPGSGKYYVKVRVRQAGEVSCKRTQTGYLQVTDLEGV